MNAAHFQGGSNANATRGASTRSQTRERSGNLPDVSPTALRMFTMSHRDAQYWCVPRGQECQFLSNCHPICRYPENISAPSRERNRLVADSVCMRLTDIVESPILLARQVASSRPSFRHRRALNLASRYRNPHMEMTISSLTIPPRLMQIKYGRSSGPYHSLHAVISQMTFVIFLFHRNPSISRNCHA